jgi:predicted MPP superfamily phosphohydrolase
LRVAHLTDLHVGLITPHAAQRAAVRLANASRPELVALTGDFVGFGHRYLGRLTSIVAAFEAPVVAVLGNHDHWAGAAEVRAALERAGALVLQNEWSELRIRGQALQVVGVDDAYTGHQDVARAVRGLRPGRAALGLSHVGEEAPELWAAGVPLVLSGHTHAGHVTWGRFHHRLVGDVFGHRFVHGLYGSRTAEPPEGALYVAAGIGSARIPVRVGDRARREVALFDLGLAPGTVDEHHDEEHPHQRPRQGRRPPPWLTARRRRFVDKERRRRELQQAVRERLGRGR